MGGTRCTCGAGCLTFGACMRNKNIRVGYCQSAKNHDRTRQQQWDKELELYASARRQGVKPAGTSTAATRFALDQSDKLGKAFDAGSREAVT